MTGSIVDRMHDVSTILRQNAPAARSLQAVVAIPVRNEVAHIGACLDAFAGLEGLRPGRLGVLLFLNNCTDGTADLVCQRLHAFPWPLRVIESNSTKASAGWARRSAMEAASNWLAETGAPDGLILTTDADTRVGADWVCRNLGYIAAGADAVAGRVVLDPTDMLALPEALLARGRLEVRYEALLAEIGARLDPEPGNPWPCHWSASGASLAVRRAVYLASGGVPALACGEDRAFVDRLRAFGARVRQAPDIVVVTSGRLHGRAPGGAADTIRLRCENPDSPCDDRLEALPRALRRALLRRRLRRLYAMGGLKALYAQNAFLCLPNAALSELVLASTFECAHKVIEAASPRLAFQPLRPSQLPFHIRMAVPMVSLLRLRDRLRPATRRADTPLRGSDALSAQTQPTSG